jgi:murein DD-endopeptidase MepM/ murein hydrolase activator NlpD
MQILITHGSSARTRVLRFNWLQAVAALAGLVIVLLLLSGTVYHLIFLKAAREGWPVVSQVMRLVVRDEFAQRDRFMRENLDAMAQKLGEMQAKLIKLEAIGERVSGLAGVKPDELKQIAPAALRGGQGGPYVPARSPSLDQLKGMVSSLDEAAEQSNDLFTMIESRLFEKRLIALMVPNSQPVSGPVGSGFGFRTDPFTGRPALHTGLDFPGDVGSPIMAAAGGVVRSADFHPAYGNLLEIDHGNGLTTRYAHASKFLVKAGDLVKRGQVVAQVGTTGRSTGPHLHFEVMVEGVLQNPAKFLAGKPPPAVRTAAATPLRSVAAPAPVASQTLR